MVTPHRRWTILLNAHKTVMLLIDAGVKDLSSSQVSFFLSLEPFRHFIPVRFDALPGVRNEPSEFTARPLFISFSTNLPSFPFKPLNQSFNYFPEMVGICLPPCFFQQRYAGLHPTAG